MIFPITVRFGNSRSRSDEEDRANELLYRERSLTLLSLINENLKDLKEYMRSANHEQKNDHLDLKVLINELKATVSHL